MKTLQQPWHSRSKEEVVQDLATSLNGLSEEETKKRLSQYGYNELLERKRRTALQMFLEEFKDIFILLLIAATVFSVIIGYYEMTRNPELGFLETYADAITHRHNSPPRRRGELHSRVPRRKSFRGSEKTNSAKSTVDA